MCDYGAGCTRKGCMYRHPPKPTAAAAAADKANAEVCKPFLAGICSYGSRCYNRHPATEEANELRRKFRKTACKWGDDCRSEGCLFSHPSDVTELTTHFSELDPTLLCEPVRTTATSAPPPPQSCDEVAPPAPLRGLENVPAFGDDPAVVAWRSEDGQGGLNLGMAGAPASPPAPPPQVAAVLPVDISEWRPDAIASAWPPSHHASAASGSTGIWTPSAAAPSWQPDAAAPSWQPDAAAPSWQPDSPAFCPSILPGLSSWQPTVASSVWVPEAGTGWAGGGINGR